MTILPDTRTDHGGTHVPILRLPYAGSSISRLGGALPSCLKPRRCQACASALSLHAPRVSSAREDRSICPPSVLPDFAFRFALLYRAAGLSSSSCYSDHRRFAHRKHYSVTIHKERSSRRVSNNFTRYSRGEIERLVDQPGSPLSGRVISTFDSCARVNFFCAVWFRRSSLWSIRPPLVQFYRVSQWEFFPIKLCLKSSYRYGFSSKDRIKKFLSR